MNKIIIFRNLLKNNLFMKKFFLLMLIVMFLFPCSGFATVSESNVKSVVQIKIWDENIDAFVSTGSGFLIDSMNILTNYHVVEDAIKDKNRYTIIFCVNENIGKVPNCSYMASPYGIFNDSNDIHYNEDLDLALITFKYKYYNKTWTSMMDLPITEMFPLMNNIELSSFGYDENVNINIGDTVEALGFPAEGGNTITYSKGEVLGFLLNNQNRIISIITSARITPGSSGGAAFDSSGKLIGSTNAMYHDNGEFLAGLIIPATTVNLWMQNAQGYRIGKNNEFTIVSEDLEKTIDEIVNSNQDNQQNNSNSECKLNTYYVKSIDGTSDWPPCVCPNGYTWTINENNFEYCKKSSIDKSNLDINFSNKLKGNILLQVEQNGEAYYIYPKDSMRYYLGRPVDAFNVMRKLGLGASHEFITKYTYYPDDVLGKILLDVEQNGEAYYIYPKDKKAYYLGRPDDAFKIMRELGLGITNIDLSKIAEGSL
jgi:hypothetical protein